MLKRFLLSVVACSVMLGAGAAYAQRDIIEILRSDLRTQKKAILTQALALSEAESDAFWPIYNEYEAEIIKVNDARVAIIKEYGANYNTMTDVVAKDLVKRSFKWQEDRTKLMKKYHGKFEKALTPVVAARWVQAEHAIDTMIDVQVASELPLIK